MVQMQGVPARQDRPVVEEAVPGTVRPEQAEGDPPLPGQQSEEDGPPGPLIPGARGHDSFGPARMIFHRGRMVPATPLCHKPALRGTDCQSVLPPRTARPMVSLTASPPLLEW